MNQSRVDDLFEYFNWGDYSRAEVMSKIINSDDTLKAELIDMCIHEAAVLFEHTKNNHLHELVRKATKDWAEEQILHGLDNWERS